MKRGICQYIARFCRVGSGEDRDLGTEVRDLANRPLAGVLVLDFSRLFPGPYCTSLLQSLGARVLKIEDTVTGDPARHYAPHIEGAGAAFVAFNRGKESLSVDLKRPEGQAIALALAARADVVVEGFRPGVARRLGIDFETLSAHNRRLIYCAISGYSQQGVQRDQPGHDLAYAASSGFLDALFPDAPAVPGIQLLDAASGLVAVIRILAALHVRDTGPHYLDVPIVAGAEALMPAALVELSVDESEEAARLSDVLKGSERYNLFHCADGRWIAVTPLEDKFWRNLEETLTREGLLDPGVALTSEVLGRIFEGRSSADWLRLLQTADVPIALVRTLEEVEREGSRFPTIPGQDDEARPVPRLGEHTVQTLLSLGYPPEEVSNLEKEGVIRAAGVAVS